MDRDSGLVAKPSCVHSGGDGERAEAVGFLGQVGAWRAPSALDSRVDGPFERRREEESRSRPPAGAGSDQRERGDPPSPSFRSAGKGGVNWRDRAAAVA